jgi:hypothetical protein
MRQGRKFRLSLPRLRQGMCSIGGLETLKFYQTFQRGYERNGPVIARCEREATYKNNEAKPLTLFLSALAVLGEDIRTLNIQNLTLGGQDYFLRYVVQELLFPRSSDFLQTFLSGISQTV